MKKFRAVAVYEVELYADIEAKDEDEAWDIAMDMDGGDFLETSEGNWRIYDVHELDEEAEDEY